MSAQRTILAGLAALAAPLPAYAAVETRGSIDVAANVGFANNPFASTGGDTSSGFGEVDIAPNLQFVQPRSTVTLSGDVNVQQYFRRYSSSENYRVSLDYRGTPTERLTTHARIDYLNAIIGSYGGFNSVGPIDPASGITLPVNDLALFGTRDRRQNLHGGADFTDALSSRDSISGSVFGDVTRYRSFSGLGDYDGGGGTLGYSRQVSQEIRVGLQGSGNVYNYRGQRGTTRAYSIEGTVSAKPNERWTVDGRLGVSFVDSNTLGSTRKTSLSGDLNLCRRGPLTLFCVDVSRQVRPTGFNGTQYVSAVSANWNYQLSERDTVTLTGNYSRENGAQSVLLPSLRTRYFGGSAGYARRVSERLRLTTSVQYRDVSGGGFNRSPDYGGRIGIAYRIGDLR